MQVKQASRSRTPTGQTARDLMTANPVSLREDATLPEILAFLTDTGFSAAPVIDDAGQPLGVISRTDIVVYDRTRTRSTEAVPGWYHQPDLAAARVGEMIAHSTPSEVSLADQEAQVRARDLMTPAVFSVLPETPALEVAEEMVALNVHRIFVVDRDRTLVGVISALDLLGYFCHSAQGKKESDKEE
jgi:CBS domain-containing protein